MPVLSTVDFIIIASFAALILLYLFVRDWYGIREQPRRVDSQAAEMLREHGYRIAAKAAVKFIDFDLGGRCHRQRVKADLVVRRGLKKYVVEVNAKDGGGVRNADIRRRLLEYQIAFGPEGILKVDIERNRVRIIKISNRRKLLKLLGVVTAASLGAVLYLLVR